MKKITLFIISLLITPVVFSQNLITNGNFETGDLTGWSTFNNTIAIEGQIVYGSYVFPGGYGDTDTSGDDPITHAACLLTTGVGVGTDLWQQVTVTPGKTYNVRFFFRPSASTSWNSRIRDRTGNANGSFLNLTPIVPDSGANALNATNYGCEPDASNTTLDWEEASYSFTVPTGVTTVRFLNFINNNMVEIFIDDVSIVDASSLSVSDLKVFNFSVSPNPTKDILTLNAKSNIDKIELFNIMGQRVLEQTIGLKSKDINMSDLSQGLYILKAQIGDKTGSYRVIKD